MKQHCQYTQYSDQKMCHRCGHTWDMNDPEPPKCLTAKALGKAWLAYIREQLRG